MGRFFILFGFTAIEPCPGGLLPPYGPGSPCVPSLRQTGSAARAVSFGKRNSRDPMGTQYAPSAIRAAPFRAPPHRGRNPAKVSVSRGIFPQRSYRARSPRAV